MLDKAGVRGSATVAVEQDHADFGVCLGASDAVLQSYYVLWAWQCPNRNVKSEHGSSMAEPLRWLLTQGRGRISVVTAGAAAHKLAKTCANSGCQE